MSYDPSPRLDVRIISGGVEYGRYRVVCPFCQSNQDWPVVPEEVYIHATCTEKGLVVFVNSRAIGGLREYFIGQREEGNAKGHHGGI